jgi:uncharacterized protein YlxW (UPF0749 family)
MSWRWWAIVVLAIVLVGSVAGRAAIRHYADARFAARETALMEEIAKYRSEGVQQAQVAQAARAEAAELREKVSQYRQQVAELLKARSSLQREVASLTAARQQAREEVSRVPEAEVRNRIRDALRDLRTPIPGP